MRIFRLSDIILLALLLASGAYAWYVFPHETRTVISQIRWIATPCDHPLTYRVDDIDPRFHVSPDEIHRAVTEAAEMWNRGTGRTLLAEDPVDGIVTIHLEYDDRQATTQRLASTTDPREYNAIVLASEREFDQGEYTARAGVQMVNIFEYSTHTALVRILAHELGHALGMEHVDDPNAIMYYMNNGTSLAITTADYTAISAVCSDRVWR